MSAYYELFCKTEEKVVYEWKDDPPTVCPHNSVHEIITNSIKESTNSFTAEENSEGYFETTHIPMDIPSGTPGDITEHDVSWDMDILLWMTYLTPTSDMIGDEISVLAAPETTVGVLTAPAGIGDTVLNVNSTVTDNVWRGFIITLDDGVNKDVLGRCTAVDAGAGTITVKTPTSFAFAAGTTPVKMSIYVIKDIYVMDTETIPIGGKGFRGKNLPAGTILRVYYTNNSGTAKLYRWRIEYYNIG